MLQRVQGPLIAKALDGDTWAELPWVATEFVDGPDLARLVSEHGPLDPMSWDGLTDVTAPTSTGMCIGTIGWLEPEQVRDEPTAAATDIFAVGAALAYA